jgi:heme iron utilization protein
MPDRLAKEQSKGPAKEPLMPLFDGRPLVRELLTEATHATLGTLDETGAPFTSLVALAKDDDMAPIIITSHLSRHTAHLEKDGRISLLVARIGKGDPLAHPRVTLSGIAQALRPGDTEYSRLRVLYLAQNPKAQLYVDLPGFWFWLVRPQSVALNGGFGKAWNGAWSEL